MIRKFSQIFERFIKTSSASQTTQDYAKLFKFPTKISHTIIITIKNSNFTSKKAFMKRPKKNTKLNNRNGVVNDFKIVISTC